MREGCRRLRRGEKPCDIIRHEFADATHVGGHDGRAHRGIFQDGIGERLRTARKHGHVHQRHYAHGICNRAEPADLAFNPQIAGELPHLAAIVGLLDADRQKSRVWMFVEHQPSGTKKGGIVLDRPNRGHHSYYLLAIANSE